MRSIQPADSLSLRIKVRFSAIEKIALYHPKSCSITSAVSHFFESCRPDSQNKSSSKVFPTVSKSCFIPEISESLCIFHPREMLLSVMTTKADFERRRDLLIERSKR